MDVNIIDFLVVKLGVSFTRLHSQLLDVYSHKNYSKRNLLFICQSVNMHLAPLCACMSPPVPPEDPIVDGSPELLLMAGNPYNLTCVTRGAKPAAHIQWNKDGIPVEGAYHSTVSTTTHMLYLLYLLIKIRMHIHMYHIHI